MSFQNVTLYHYWRSSCSWRVRWALNHKNITYQSKIINLLQGEQRAPEFLLKNPQGMIPCLEIDGHVVNESLAILELLEEIKPSPSLLPTDPWMRQKARELSLLVVASIQPLQNLRILARLENQAQKDEWCRHVITEGLQAYEGILLKQNLAGTYSIGSQLTIADLCLIPQVYNAVRFHADLKLFPTCYGIYERCLKLPACDAAAPQNQPGAQK